MDYYFEEMEQLRSKLHSKIAEKKDFLCDPQVLALSRELDEYINMHYYQKEGKTEAKDKLEVMA